MKLADHIEETGLSREEYAAKVGTSTSAIYQLCKDPPGYWPGKEVCLRIRAESRGRVTPNDFLPPYVPEDGDAARSADAGHAASGDATHSADAGLPASRGLPLLGQEEDQPREAAE